MQVIGFYGKTTVHHNTQSKCPGGYPILHRGLKLNSKILARNYKKMNFTWASWFSAGELDKNCI